jgi:transposase InsO family protein
VKYGFIQGQQKAYPVTALCSVMQVSRSAYYAWAKRPGATAKDQERQQMEQRAAQIFADSRRTYGSRRLSRELKKAGFDAGRHQTRSIMAKLNLQPRYPRRFKVTTDSNHGESISPNLLDRQFDVAAPNQVWTTDITYVWTLEGWLYVAIVIDLFSRRVVGWAAGGHMRASLCVQALQMAFWRKRPEPGLLHHSDRGSQYASAEYRGQLKAMGMRQSMSRKGNCWDNSPTERVFRSLKHEQLNYERFETGDQAKLSVIDYLAFYNGRRSHSKLGYKTPLEFERDYYSEAA